MKGLWTYLLTILSVSAILSCSSDSCRETPDTSKINVEIQVDRLDEELAEIKSKDQLRAFFSTHPEVKQILAADQYPSDSVFIDEFFKVLVNPHTDTIFQDVKKVFGNLSDINKQLEEAFKNIKYYYPDFHIPRIRTLASGFFAPDFYLSDSVIYISLDYFTGHEGHYTPPDEPDYIKRRYRKEYVVPTLMRIVSTSLNATNDSDNTLLAEMVYWGKSYYFVSQVLPCTPDSLIIGYTNEQLQAAISSQERIWSHFVEKQLIFETSHFQKTKYIGDRPYTAEIGSKAPGRIGQWLGWKIVNKYMDEQDNENLKSLMAIGKAQTIFDRSRFKPQNGKDW